MMTNPFDELKKRLQPRSPGDTRSPDQMQRDARDAVAAGRNAAERATAARHPLGSLLGILDDTAKREEKKAHDAIEDAKCTPGELVLLTHLRKIESSLETLRSMSMMNTLMDAMPLLSKLGEKQANEAAKPDEPPAGEKP